MLRSPLFPNHIFNFIFLLPESSINAPKTTLVCVLEVEVKKKTRQSRFVHASLVRFIFPRLERTVNNHNMLQCQFLL